jgi:hypothetical protein
MAGMYDMEDEATEMSPHKGFSSLKRNFNETHSKTAEVHPDFLIPIEMLIQGYDPLIIRSYLKRKMQAFPKVIEEKNSENYDSDHQPD